MPEGVPRGRVIAVFFDPASEWYSLISAISARRLKEGGKVVIITTTRFPDQIRSELESYKINPRQHEERLELFIADWYSWVTGKQAMDKYNLPGGVAPSLRIEDLTLIINELWMAKAGTKSEDNPLFIDFVICDNFSNVFLYNPAEKVLRSFNQSTARAKQDGRVVYAGFASRMHSEQIYASLESIVDGVLDVTTRDIGGELKTFLRVRRFQGVEFVKGWYEVRKLPFDVELVRDTSV